MTSAPSLQADFVARRDGFELELSFEIPAGGTVAVVGPNGAGKSTLISVLAGFQPLHRGILRFGDQVLDEPASGTFAAPEQRPFALVPQDGLLFPHLNVLANVGFGLRHRRPDLDRASREAAANEALDAVGLADMGSRRPSELSGGQAQRAAVARALALAADVLLLDEPLSNVDVDNRQLIRKLLRVHRPPNQIQMVVTHGRDHAHDADELLVLEQGRLIAQGTPSALQAGTPSDWLSELLR